MTFNNFFELLVVLIILTPLIFFEGCSHIETQHSRDYLNCVYHYQYELGLRYENAVNRCQK